LGSAADSNLQAIDPTFPFGDLIFAEVPFHIPAGVNNVVWNNNHPSGTVIYEIPVNRFGVTQVHTLLNTTFGQRGPSSYLRLEFIGDGGAFHVKEMIGNMDIRDLNKNQNVWTTTINNTTTVNVFETPQRQYLIDKQPIRSNGRTPQPKAERKPK
jgi:hypothetical protein